MATLQDSLEELQTRLSFQEDTIDALNDQVRVLFDENGALRRQLELVNERMAALSELVEQMQSQSQRQAPPHY